MRIVHGNDVITGKTAPRFTVINLPICPKTRDGLGVHFGPGVVGEYGTAFVVIALAALSL
jgi:hypothetical protein